MSKEKKILGYFKIIYIFIPVVFIITSLIEVINVLIQGDISAFNYVLGQIKIVLLSIMCILFGISLKSATVIKKS